LLKNLLLIFFWYSCTTDDHRQSSETCFDNIKYEFQTHRVVFESILKITIQENKSVVLETTVKIEGRRGDKFSAIFIFIFLTAVFF